MNTSNANFHVKRRNPYALPITIVMLLFPFVAALGIYPATAFRPTNLRPAETLDEFYVELGANLPQVAKTYSLPGISVAVYSQNVPHYFITGKSSALFPPQKGGLLGQQTLFPIASMSKTQCAMAVMKLVQEGLLDLDQPVESYLTRWHLPASEWNDGVTIRRILCHAAGLNVGGVNAGAFKLKNVPPIDQALENEGVRVIAEPGSTYIYSGGGFGILQLVIEEVSGMAYDDFLAQNIFQPMGFAHTRTFLNQSAEADYVRPHLKNRIPIPAYHNSLAAAAGHYASIEDLITWAARIMENQTALANDTNREMLTPQWGDHWGYALGFHWEKLANGRYLFGHGGDNTGAHGAYWFIPSTGDAIAVLTNGEWGAAVVDQIVSLWKSVVDPTGVSFEAWQAGQRGMNATNLPLIVVGAVGSVVMVGFFIFSQRFYLSTRKFRYQRYTRVAFGILRAASLILFAYLALRWNFLDDYAHIQPWPYFWRYTLDNWALWLLGVQCLGYFRQSKRHWQKASVIH